MKSNKKIIVRIIAIASIILLIGIGILSALFSFKEDSKPVSSIGSINAVVDSTVSSSDMPFYHTRFSYRNFDYFKAATSSEQGIDVTITTAYTNNFTAEISYALNNTSISTVRDQCAFEFFVKGLVSNPNISFNPQMYRASAAGFVQVEPSEQYPCGCYNDRLSTSGEVKSFTREDTLPFELTFTFPDKYLLGTNQIVYFTLGAEMRYGDFYWNNKSYNIDKWYNISPSDKYLGSVFRPITISKDNFVSNADGVVTYKVSAELVPDFLIKFRSLLSSFKINKQAILPIDFVIYQDSFKYADGSNMFFYMSPDYPGDFCPEFSSTEESFQTGYQSGYQDGYKNGYVVGMNKGASDALTSQNPLSYFFDPVQSFFDTPFLGRFRFGDVLGVFMFVAIALLFLKMFSGG